MNGLKRYVRGFIALMLKCISHFPSHHFRNFILKYFFGLKKHKKAVLYSGFVIRSPKNISIGEGTVVGYNCDLDGRRGLEIGKNVNISSDVMLYTLQHDYQDKGFAAVGDKVIIGDYAWISARAIILPGVIVGEGAVVAAGAVVTKTVEPYSIVGGIPAKKIGERNKDLSYNPAEYRLPFV